MNPVIAPHQGRTQEMAQPDATVPARLTTTLYDVMATLQTVVEPDEDKLVIAVVVYWVRTGCLTFVSDVTVAA
jgi:hypothetical protein